MLVACLFAHPPRGPGTPHVFYGLAISVQTASITHSSRSDEVLLSRTHHRHSVYRGLFTDACPCVQAIATVFETSVVRHCVADWQDTLTYLPLTRGLARCRLLGPLALHQGNDKS